MTIFVSLLNVIFINFYSIENQSILFCITRSLSSRTHRDTHTLIFASFSF